MESGFLCGMENLDVVWKRVRGESPPPMSKESDGAAELLRRRMDEKYAMACFYAALAQNGANAERSLLLRLCSAEKRHFRCLQLEYFLLTGCCHTPTESCARKACLLHGVRLARERELAAAQQFQTDARAAQATLRETLQCIAREDEKHARQLYALLQKRIVGGK